jgi:hypothetical protein
LISGHQFPKSTAQGGLAKHGRREFAMLEMKRAHDLGVEITHDASKSKSGRLSQFIGSPLQDFHKELIKRPRVAHHKHHKVAGRVER